MTKCITESCTKKMEKKDGRGAHDNKKRKLNKDDIFSDYKIEGQIIDLLTFLTEEITTLKKGSQIS